MSVEILFILCISGCDMVFKNNLTVIIDDFLLRTLRCGKKGSKSCAATASLSFFLMVSQWHSVACRVPVLTGCTLQQVYVRFLLFCSIQYFTRCPGTQISRLTLLYSYIHRGSTTFSFFKISVAFSGQQPTMINAATKSTESQMSSLIFFSHKMTNYLNFQQNNL